MLVSPDDFSSSPELQRQFLIKMWQFVMTPCECNRCASRRFRCRQQRSFDWCDIAVRQNDVGPRR